MAPLKFEERIKEQLEERVIEPSDNSWDRLETALTKTKHKQKRLKKNWQYGIAAIFAGLIIFTSIKINENSVVDKGAPKIVDSSREVIENKNVPVIEKLRSDTLLTPHSRTELVEIESKKSLPNSLSSFSQKENISSIKKKGITAVISTEEQKKTVTSNFYSPLPIKGDSLNAIAHELSVVDSTLIENKLKEMAAQIKEIEDKEGGVTEEEISRLLLEAQREITTKKLMKSTTIDATALLQGVEDELSETFKQKVFEALKSGFQKVRTAVVTRNNQ
ncbi:hypothetical protein [Aquimarina pacifica]|uniref:hypothetical protein n=1 Tax=Aquimarina pacifica TaxID=1296415 RepID=UPI0004717A83|nr:hypothetical protein [Aquimarina pacifica]